MGKMDFGRCCKCFNSEWDWDIVGDSMNNKGERFHTYYIKSGDRRPELGECIAIAKYLGWEYRNGYFYEKII